MIENEDKAERLYGRIKDKCVRKFLNALMQSMAGKAERFYAVTNEFKYKLPNAERCSFYIRPSSARVDIYLEKFSPADISIKNRLRNLPIIVGPNTANPKDQFRSVIKVDSDWLTEHHDKVNDLLTFINELVDAIAGDYA
jgi:hypothetical protein